MSQPRSSQGKGCLFELGWATQSPGHWRDAAYLCWPCQQFWLTIASLSEQKIALRDPTKHSSLPQAPESKEKVVSPIAWT